MPPIDGFFNTFRKSNGMATKRGELIVPIDTIGIRSPYILKEMAQKIEKVCKRIEGTDLKTGEILYRITTGRLTGSYDSSISIRVLSDYAFDEVRGYREQFYIQLECSIHKALLGHNVFGGPEGFRESVHWLVRHVEQLLGDGVRLPDPDLWLVYRIDVAEVFELDSFEACQEYFRGLVVVDYARRKVRRYGNETVYVTGTTTTLKIYHKGPEFYNHDRKRLRLFMASDKLFSLQMKAHKILRVECGIKAKKLKYDFGHLPVVSEVSDNYMISLYDKEITRLMKEGAKDMEIVRTAHDVEKRLYDVYRPALAGRLLGTWFKLSAFGEDYVKKSIAKSTFYWQRKKLVDAGVSWNNTDVVLKEEPSLIPKGFTLLRSDPRRLTGEADEVKAKLSGIRRELQEKEKVS